jgi:hypothetical protein
VKAEELQKHPVLVEIAAERTRQDQLWGIQDHEATTWLAILLKQVGQAADAGLNGRPADLRKQFVQVASVAVAAIESYDRNASKEDHQ